MQNVLIGLALGLAGVFAIAVVGKLRNLEGFEATVTGLLPQGVWRGGLTSRHAAFAVIALEAMIAVLLVVGGELALVAAALATVTLAALLTAVVSARRRRVPCSCFGDAKPVQGAQIARTGGLTVAAVTLLAAALAGDGAAGAAAGGVASVAIAVAIVLLAIAPSIKMALRARPAVQASARADSGAGLTRRAVLQGALAGVLAVMAGGVLARDAEATAARTCQGQFDLCYGCVTKDDLGGDTNCCIQCYSFCQLGGPFCYKGASCNGCWPGFYD